MALEAYSRAMTFGWSRTRALCLIALVAVPGVAMACPTGFDPCTQETVIPIGDLFGLWTVGYLVIHEDSNGILWTGGPEWSDPTQFPDYKIYAETNGVPGLQRGGAAWLGFGFEDNCQMGVGVIRSDGADGAGDNAAAADLFIDGRNHGHPGDLPNPT